MQIETITVSSFETNCYLVWDEKDKSCAIVDPGDEHEKILEWIDNLHLKPKAILLTHGHVDHIAAVGKLKDKFDIPLYIGRGDEEMLASSSANGSAFFGQNITCPSPDHIVGDADVIKVGSHRFVVMATPGHSRGGVCYIIDKYLFCGDTLFNGSIGRTDLPGGNYQLLIDSINKNILSLPDDIICYPGHGPATTVGEEKRNNPFLSGSRFV